MASDNQAKSGRPEFRAWVDREPEPEWKPLPLTHITKSFLANDIVRDRKIAAEYCDVLKDKFAFLFYGRPAYRVSGDGGLTRAAPCPFCFIFEPSLLKLATASYAFDTGAFGKRLYKGSVFDEMDIRDFCLDQEASRPNRLISRAFGSIEKYYDAIPDPDRLGEDNIPDWEFLAKAYADLIMSGGRNEPDDRVCTIEVVFDESTDIMRYLTAVVVPHIIWSDKSKAPWLSSLDEAGVRIVTYEFKSKRTAEYHHALVESEARRLMV